MGPTQPRSRSRRLADLVLAAAILGVLIVVAARLDRVEKRDVEGITRVTDGDSIEMGSEIIRLRGIDAPEFSQICRMDGLDYACGRRARDALVAMIGKRPVTCSGWERDRYGRLLASCRAGEAELNRELVKAGWAVAYGGFEAEERAARTAGAGLWAGSFDRPRDWRAQHGGMAESEHAALARIYNWLRRILRFEPARPISGL